jgi:4-hydroxy-4-methyl-2-oxoglutarate aldolase
MSTRPTSDQLDALQRFGTATIHEAQGGTGALTGAIKPLDPSRSVAGPALTVDCRPGDNLAIHFALTVARPGDVLVVDAKAFVEAGPWGDIMSLAAMEIGIAGLVIDGAVRDSSSIVALGFPVFARGVCIKGTNKVQPGDVRVPIVCGDALIHPGDVIVGDADGVVVVDQHRTEEVISLSQAREQKEDKFRAQIQSGARLADLIGIADDFAHLGYR